MLENLYGPTEATIFCTAYRWDPARSPAQCELGIVPIGWPLPRMSARVVDGELRDVRPGDEGELLVAGPQVAGGYLDEPEKTANAFVRLGEDQHVHYRTGDQVRNPIDDGPLVFRGRLDHQVKILGHRVELGEVEAALRSAAGAHGAVAVGWPRTASGAGGIVAFVQGTTMDGPSVRAAVAQVLPVYMVPRDVRVLDELPLTRNGKIDRVALLQSLEGSRMSSRPTPSADQVRAFILARFTKELAAKGLAPEDLEDSFDLLIEGVIDSFGIVELVMRLEEEIWVRARLLRPRCRRFDPHRAAQPLCRGAGQAWQRNDRVKAGACSATSRPRNGISPPRCHSYTRPPRRTSTGCSAVETKR